MSETMLRHVNVPPAQTWNYLKINDITLTAPEPPAKGTAAASQLANIEMGAGTEATAWADAATPERRLVYVEPNTSETVRIFLDDEHPLLATDIVVGAGGSVRIAVTEALTASSASSQLASSCLRIHAEHDARVELITVVAGTAQPQFLDNVGIRLDERAYLESRQYVLTASTTALGLAVDLAGNHARADMRLRYLVRSEEMLDVNYLARMHGCDSRCDISISGVLENGAKKTVRDTIDLAHGGKRARGREDETVLLAGDHVVNKSLPVILCDEDDVAGDHGATIGSLSQEQLSYLADRGLVPGEATALFSRAVADDAHAHADSATRKIIRAAAQLIWNADVAQELQCAEEDMD